MTATPIDVVILTWNDGALLRDAVESAIVAHGVDVAVVIVDNGSSPPAVALDDARVRVLRNESNRGVAPARNQGVRAGQADYVCLLDSDARLTPDALARMAGLLDREPEVALVAPVFAGQPASAGAGPKYSLLHKAQRALNLRDTYEEGDAFVDGRRYVDFAIGACQLFRRRAFEAVGGLDESYFYGPEDVDFCLRLREAGWGIVQLEHAIVDHPARRRNKHLLTKRGLRHGWAVARHLWRHRRFSPHVASR